MRNWDEVAQLQIFKKLRFVANAFIERMAADGSVNQFPAVSLPYVLAQSAVAVSCPVDTTEDVLVSIPIPAKVMGPNGSLRLTTLWTWSGIGAKTPRIRFGGAAGTQYFNTQQNGANLKLRIVAEIFNRGAFNSQVGGGHLVVPDPSSLINPVLVGATSAVDTGVATSVVVSGQKVTAGDTMTLDAYLAEVLYGA
jgi:hypothetical protein